MFVGHHIGHACGDIACFGRWIYQWSHRWKEACLSSPAITGASCASLRWVLLGRLTRNCSKILLIEVRCEWSMQTKSQVVYIIWTHFWNATVILYCSQILRFSAWVRQDNIHISSCLMLLLASPALYVRECRDHSLPQFGPLFAPSCSRPWGSCRSIFCPFFDRDRIRLSLLSEYVWSRWRASLFWCVLIKPHTHAQWIACAHSANNTCLCLSRSLKVNSLLARLRLEIFLKRLCHFSWRCDPLLWLVCASVTSFASSRLPSFILSVSFNIDIHMIRPLKSNGSVDPKNGRISVLIRIAVWPDNMCQRDCANLPVSWY